MISTCPSCLSQISHEDHDFEVVCSCGSRFNPFATVEDLPPLEPSLGAQPVDSNPDDFSESNSVFQELVTFGENLSTAITEKPAAAPKSEDAEADEFSVESVTSAPLRTKPRGETVSSGNVIISASPVLEGYKISAYHGMVSAATELDAASEDPLKSVFDTLCAKAESRGANGVLACAWWISPDGTRAIGSGSAVRIERNEPLEK